MLMRALTESYIAILIFQCWISILYLKFTRQLLWLVLYLLLSQLLLLRECKSNQKFDLKLIILIVSSIWTKWIIFWIMMMTTLMKILMWILTLKSVQLIKKVLIEQLFYKDLIKLTSYKKIMNSWQCDYWIAAMQVKINELIRIEIWKLVKSSKKWKIIKKCWIYHIKLNANNEIIKFKTC